MSATRITATDADTSIVLVEPRGRVGFIRRFLNRPSTLAALAWIVLLVVFSVLPSQLAPYDPLAQDLAHSLSGPSAIHWLGTDGLGRDVLSRLIFGTKVAMLGALLAMGISIVLGVPAGLVAGFVGGKADAFISRITDMIQALPIIIVLMAVMAALGNSMWIGMAAFGVLAAAVLVRIVRAATESIRDALYVDAARVSKVPRRVIVVRHILPMVMNSVLVQGSVLMGVSVLIGAGLTFLGLGYAPPEPTWGSLIKDAGESINIQPWLMIPPGIITIVTVVVFNVLGDALRDASPLSLRGSQFSSAKRAARVPGGQQTIEEPDAMPAKADEEAAHDDLISGQKALVVTGLSVMFGSVDDPLKVVDHVDFNIRRGEAVGLVGESGCGKTMTALAILGLLPPGGRLGGRGRIIFEGQNIAGLPERRLAAIRGAKISYVSQEPMVSLDPSFTIMSQLVEPLRIHGKITRPTARKRAIESLERVGIPRPLSVARGYPHQISGGMAQRVAIAVALTGNPSLLLADEPTTALDVTVQAEILDLLRSLQQTTEMSLLLVTHDLGVVADICTRVVVMYAGQVVEQGPVSEVLTRPSHPYTAALLTSMPASVGADETLRTIPGSVPNPGAWPQGCHFAPRCPFAEDKCTIEPIKLRTVRPMQHTRCLLSQETIGKDVVLGALR